MDPLDQLYIRLLQVGFVVLNQAVESDRKDWLRIELEWLHNVPSLIGDSNFERHRYFWQQERPHYLQWVATQGPEEAKSRSKTYYEPILNEMEPLIEQRIRTARAG
jgi:hypothetical protein